MGRGDKEKGGMEVKEGEGEWDGRKGKRGWREIKERWGDRSE